jgi:hypothetical protein
VAAGAGLRNLGKADQRAREDLRKQGYVETGETGTIKECTDQGGTVQGDYCLMP